MNITTRFPAGRILYFFLALHLLLWTIIPACLRCNLPLDAMEGVIWGQHLQWGYDKNPWLNGWLTGFATFIDGRSGWMIYLFSQICVISCMWAMWQLGKKILSPIHALIAVLLLECMQYFNFHAIDFNDNTLELSLWGLASYTFYLAVHGNSIAWMLTGLLLALGMMAKYYTLALIVSMFLFLIIYPQNRQYFFRTPFYYGLIIFVLVCSPHVAWLYQNNFITVHYVLERGSSLPSWKNHFVYPVKFLWQQLQVVLPVMIPCVILSTLTPAPSPLAEKRSGRGEALRRNIHSSDLTYLFFVGCLPLLLTLFLCFITGIKLRAGWGMPLLSTWGIILIAIIQPRITKQRMTIFLSFICLLITAEISAYIYKIIYPTTTSTANFPGKEIAARMTNEWHKKYHTKLAYVGGSRWVGGNISFYSDDHPAVFVELDQHRAPWIDQKDMQEKGAIFVWQMSQWKDLPQKIAQDFLSHPDLQVITFEWHRHADEMPVKIGMVIVPPKHSPKV